MVNLKLQQCTATEQTINPSDERQSMRSMASRGRLNSSPPDRGCIAQLNSRPPESDLDSRLETSRNSVKSSL